MRTVVNRSTLGSSKNFEQAVRLCRAPIIVLSDQDDVWNPERLACISKAFQSRPNAAAVFSDAELIDQHSKPLNGTLWESFSFTHREQRRLKNGHALEVLLRDWVVTGATMAFRAEYRDLLLPFPPDHFHDSWIAFLLASVGELTPIQDRTIQYRHHPRQQIGSRPKASLREQVVILKRSASAEYLREINLLEQVRERLTEPR